PAVIGMGRLRLIGCGVCGPAEPFAAGLSERVCEVVPVFGSIVLGFDGAPFKSTGDVADAAYTEALPITSQNNINATHTNPKHEGQKKTHLPMRSRQRERGCRKDLSEEPSGSFKNTIETILLYVHMAIERIQV